MADEPTEEAEFCNPSPPHNEETNTEYTAVDTTIDRTFIVSQVKKLLEGAKKFHQSQPALAPSPNQIHLQDAHDNLIDAACFLWDVRFVCRSHNPSSLTPSFQS